jgi:hypothetical protein
MTDLILVRQTIFVEDFECTVTELVPMYPKLTPCPAPFVKIIALPGTSGSQKEASTKATAERPSCLRMETGSGAAIGAGNESGRR